MLSQKWVSGSADCLTDEKSNADEMFRYYHEIKLSALQTGGGASPLGVSLIRNFAQKNMDMGFF